jgi:hypothetical protein
MHQRAPTQTRSIYIPIISARGRIGAYLNTPANTVLRTAGAGIVGTAIAYEAIADLAIVKKSTMSRL